MWVPGEPGLQKETLSRQNKKWKRKRKQKKEATYICRCPAKDLCIPSAFCYSLAVLASLAQMNWRALSSFSCFLSGCDIILASYSAWFPDIWMGLYKGSDGDTPHRPLCFILGLCLSISPLSLSLSLCLFLLICLPLSLSVYVSMSQSVTLFPSYPLPCSIVVWVSIYVAICCRRKPFL